MDRQQLNDWFSEWRSPSVVQWASDTALSVGSVTSDHVGEYGPSFAVNLTILPDTLEGKFSALHIGTKMVSPTPISLRLVNELNQKFRFVRHVAFDDSAIGVMLDIAENSDELTGPVLEKYMFFFIQAVKRLKSAFPAN